MRTLWHWIMGPQLEDEDLRRRVLAARVTSAFALLVLPLVILGEMLAGSSPFADPASWVTLPLTFLVPLVALVLVRIRPRVGIYWLVIAMSALMATGAIAYGLTASNFTILATLVVLAALLASTNGIILSVGACLIATIGAYATSYTQPDIDLYKLQNETIMQLAIFVLLGVLTWLFDRSLRNLARRARHQADDIAELNVALEQRIAELTTSGQQLEQTIAQNQHQTQRLVTAAQISRALSASTVGTADILDDMARLVREGLNAYYVGLLLVDDARQYAILRAATGPAGVELVAQSYRMPVDSASAVSRSMTIRRGCLAPDANAGVVLPNIAQLPDTRAELALPLITRDQILGAVSIHSMTSDAFDQQDIVILQSVADQVANAIVNARSLEQTRTALAEATKLQQTYLRDSWEQRLSTQQVTGYQYERDNLRALSHRLIPPVREAFGMTHTPTATTGAATLVTPLTLHGQVIGALGVQDPHRTEWTADEIRMTQAIAEQVAQAVDRARL
ncbi:MAG: GAF domain-containing protein, partial [Chloroflexi bacterium]|nr:GAF domain-containing protein [Chloroflexota bacterium]